MYLALARKYRPQRFKDLIGQPHVVKALQNALEMNKLYPALIFSGMKGVGKTSTARILAKALNCEKGISREPCNECRFCREITSDKSSDYIEIDGASNNGVEEVRRLRETVRYKPLQNRYRVVVIDEVHMLSNSAWNALLKTVEEPPEHTYFIMATTDFHKIPATIVSRCQHLEFRRISQEVIARLLREICDKEEVKISDYAIFLISRSADGSLRDAKKVLDQAIALSNGDVQDEELVDILGVVEEDLFIRLTEAVFNRGRSDIIHIIQELVERGADLRFFYAEYLKFLRDLIIVRCMSDAGNLHNLNPENLERIGKMVSLLKEEEMLRYFNAAKDMEMTMRHTENPRIIMEYMFLKLSYFPTLTDIEDVLRSLSEGNLGGVASSDTHSGENESPGIGEKINEPAPRESKPEVSTGNPDKPRGNDVRAWWEKDLNGERPRLTSAIQGSTVECDGKIVRIVVDGGKEFMRKVLEDHMGMLKTSLAKKFPELREIQVTLGVNRKALKEKEIRGDSVEASLAEKIKGQIVSIDMVEGEDDGKNAEHEQDDGAGAEHGPGDPGKKGLSGS